jgi:acetoin utilization deacetylase AcuC-like enzyme
MQEVKNRLGVIFFPAFDWAISPTHPERQERLLYTMDQLKEEGVFDIPGIREYKPDVAELEDVERVHFCFPDVQSNVTDSHLISAGGTIKAARLLMEGREDKIFALVRPPGHHSMKVVHGGRGFCNINIEAIMVEYLRDKYGVKKVAIVDTDCHHGDGTQDIYWHDPDTLYISIHQDGRTLYPGSGFTSELGGPKARGKTINIPLPPYTSDEGFLYAMENVVMPILEDFKAEVVVNSAGQDNHFTDPITNMNFSAQGYAKLSEILNPDLVVLEGGYSIQGALPYVNLGIVLALAGIDYSYVREPNYDPKKFQMDKRTMDYIKKVCEDSYNNYFSTPVSEVSLEKEGKWIVRNKEIFYDTSYIMERQKEYLLDCENCRGVLKIESDSTRAKNCLAIEIPLGACEKCIKTGEEEFEKGKRAGYKFIQFIDRINKRIERL